MRRKIHLKQNSLNSQNKVQPARSRRGRKSAGRSSEAKHPTRTRTGRPAAARPPVTPDPETCDLIFDYICAYVAQQGYAPSVRNIGRACQLSLSAVVYNLDKLEDRGWLARTPNVARSLRILRPKTPTPKTFEQT